jgi:hypothetical protein
MAQKSTKARKGRGGGGRVTPKGGHTGAKRSGSPRSSVGHDKFDEHTSSRYTPPTPRSAKSSPPWWPVLLFGLLGLGMLIIILDYTGLLPGTPNNWLLLPALVCISGGLLAAMNYR